jgi:dTDP-4-amino-4,6-dideoxygalactose transaminase
MLTTNDDDVAERARMLRSQGERERYLTEELGWNYRMTEPEAALGSLQLQSLDARNGRRRENALRLNELLANVEGIATPQESQDKTHAWHQYVVRVLAGRERRDALQRSLAEAGIESAVFYPLAIQKQPLYRRMGYGETQAPFAERLSGEVLALPVHPTLRAEDLEAIAAAVRSFFAG